LEVFTIGFAQKPASSFFGSLKAHGVKRLIDVRLNNKSQLAGFTKREDLEFFLRELCDAAYVHEQLLTPTQDMLKAYRAKRLDWAEYERLYLELITDRRVEEQIQKQSFETPTVLLCSEPKPDRCHRRLAAEYLATAWGEVQITHL
jgi:uncharacterized protein (DUF488 family)